MLSLSRLSSSVVTVLLFFGQCGVCSSAGVGRRTDGSSFCAELRKVNTANVKRSHVTKVVEMRKLYPLLLFASLFRKYFVRRVSALCDVTKDTHAPPWLINTPGMVLFFFFFGGSQQRAK